VHATGTSSGRTNPIEVQIALKNISNTEQQVVLESQWLDVKGRFNGGAQQVIKLSAGQSQTINLGTRSPRVTQYRASLKATSKSQDQLLTDSLASPQQQIAKGNGMTFSETPATEKIPPWSVRGVANGKPFDAKTLFFRADDKGRWKLEISDRAYDPVRGVAIARIDHPDVQTVYINLPGTPARGKVYMHKMQYGGGMFQIKPEVLVESSNP